MYKMSEEVVLEVVPDVPVDLSQFVLDVPISRVVKILSVRLRVLSLSLGESVTIGAHLDCESGGKKFNDYKEICIEGDEYLGWGADDAYIVSLVKSKLESIL
jgi:hypothetical protein